MENNNTPGRGGMLDRRLSIAPMLDWTDRHYRLFARKISRHTLLYSEMVTTGAILHGDQERHLGFSAEEHPIALQLGGSDPNELAQCARIGQRWGYDEINLNVGCPSDKVQSGMFGACLMKSPKIVGDCLAAMIDATDLPVTIKHRIGVDDQDSYQQLVDFVGSLAERGCEVFIVHARKAWLKGLSPKENREVPPLNYPWVYRLKAELPALTIVINGGIDNLAQSREHLGSVDGVMLGRSIYHNPWLLAEVDRELFGENAATLYRENVIEQLLPYVERELAAGTRLNQISRHLLGLYQQVPGARRYRRLLSEQAHRPGAGADVLLAAVAEVTRRAA